MRTIAGFVVTDGHPMPLVDGVPRMPCDGEFSMWLRESDETPEILPDLADDLTRLGLLALVREAWGDPHAYCAPGPGWYVSVASEFSKGGECWPSPTEAEALVAALEAAP